MKFHQPKKSLAQHFLINKEVAALVANAVKVDVPYKTLLEVGPGRGILTGNLIETEKEFYVVELDNRLIDILKKQFPGVEVRNEDFLKYDIRSHNGQVAIVGNFPYNISSQIVFKVIENRSQVPIMAGMFQKEVATRIAGSGGKKDYGVLSVLTQAYYDVEYLFDVPATDFDPPPQVTSGVIRLIRKSSEPDIEFEKLRTVVKAAFSTRRKTLRNCLKSLIPDKEEMQDEFFDRRAEQLSVDEFIELTKTIFPQ